MRDKMQNALHCAKCGSWANVTRAPSDNTPGYPYAYTVQCANSKCISDSVSTPTMNQSIAVWNEKQRKINSKEGRRSLSFYGHKYAARKQAVDIDAEFSSIVKSIQGER